MSLHPINDRFKIKVDNNGFFPEGDEAKGYETGVVVEVPDMLIYLSFHSFAFENSLTSDSLEKILEYYKSFMGKRIYWEAFQDRGRRIKDGEDEYIFLQMTDLLAYADDVNEKAEGVMDSREGGFKI